METAAKQQAHAPAKTVANTASAGAKAMPAVPVFQQKPKEPEEKPLQMMAAPAAAPLTKFAAPAVLPPDDSTPRTPFTAQRKEAVTATELNPIQKKENNTAQQTPIRAVLSSRSTIQRMKNVTLETDTTKKKSLVAEGKVKDFKDGTTAGGTGWLGVDKYRARYTITSKDGKYKNEGAVGPLQNVFTTGEAGHVLGQQNGGNGGDPENVFAQDGGTNNSTYKSFEIGMRKMLNKYDDGDNVEFKSYLAGDAITQGNIKDAALSEASDISSDEDEAMSD